MAVVRDSIGYTLQIPGLDAKLTLRLEQNDPDPFFRPEMPGSGRFVAYQNIGAIITFGEAARKQDRDMVRGGKIFVGDEELGILCNPKVNLITFECEPNEVIKLYVDISWHSLSRGEEKPALYA